jgi:acyl carrier protein
VTKSEIEQVVRDVLAEQFRVDPEAVRPEATFKEMGLDSLDLVSLVMALEDRFSVEIPEQDLEGVTRLADALAVLERKLGVAA